MKTIRRVSRQFLAWWVRDADRWQDPRVMGARFYANEGTREHPHVWTAVDNVGGEFFTEEFRTMKEAVAWLDEPEPLRLRREAFHEPIPLAPESSGVHSDAEGSCYCPLCHHQTTERCAKLGCRCC